MHLYNDVGVQFWYAHGGDEIVIVYLDNVPVDILPGTGPSEFQKYTVLPVVSPIRVVQIQVQRQTTDTRLYIDDVEEIN